MKLALALALAACGDNLPAAADASAEPCGNGTLATGIYSYGLAAAGGTLYYTDWGGRDATDRGIVAATCASRATLATAQAQPFFIAVDATHVYWTNPFGDTVMRVPRAGGAPETIAQATSRPNGIAVDDTSIYWAEFFGGAIVRSNKDGSAREQIATGLVTPSDLVLDADYVYFADLNGHTIGRIAKRDRQLATIVTGQIPLRLAVDESAIYWIDFGDRTIRTANKDGSAQRILASEQAQPASIAAFDTQVYWTMKLGVRAIAKSGGPVATIAYGTMPQAITVDADRIYWSQPSTATIHAVAR